MTMRCFEIRGGTLEKESGGEVEWALTQYTRTAKKKDYLWRIWMSSVRQVMVPF